MSKQPNNAGSVYQRSRDGKWIAQVVFHVEGVRKKVQRVTNTKAEAQRVRMKLLQMVESQENPAMKRHVEEHHTVEGLTSRWLDKARKSDQAWSTVQSRERHIRLYIVPWIGKILALKLQPHDVETMLTGLAESGLAKNTISNVRYTLGLVLKDAEKNGIVARNVALLADMPGNMKPDRPRGTFTLEEVKRILAAVDGHRYETAIRLGLMLGIRRGEIFGLKWEDVDFVQKTIAIKNNLQRIDGVWVCVKTKTKATNRVLPLLQDLEASLLTTKQRQEEERSSAGEYWQEEGYVLTGVRGTPLPYFTYLEYWTAMLKRLEIPYREPHCLRHTTASILGDMKVPIKVAQSILGHANYQITADRYTHLMPDSEKAYMVDMETLIRE